MSKIPVWFDCDMGVDDASALVLLCAMKELELVGLSAVAGNVELDKTFYNTRSMIEFLGMDKPVYPGADAPLMRPLRTAPNIHGNNGMGGIQIPPPLNRAETKPAWDAMYEVAKSMPGELTLIAVGPLTNVAMAMIKYGDFASLLKQIVIMGGSAQIGNTTPAAEFNILVDPEAASTVFQSGAPIVMLGLDVTMKANLSWEELDEIGRLSEPGRFIRDAFQQIRPLVGRFGLPGPALHDPCAVLYVGYPELFTGEEAGVVVETKGKITLGKTVTDLYSDHQFPFKNAKVILGVDRDSFLKTVKELTGSY